VTDLAVKPGLCREGACYPLLAIGNEKARESRKKVRRVAEEAQSTVQQEVQNQGLTNQ
jgi:hypothetical protein